MKAKKTVSKADMGGKKSFRDRAAESVADFYRRNTSRINMAVVLLLFLAAFSVRLNNIAHKSELHSDEVFSMMLCSCNPYYNQPIPDGGYSGAELKDMIVGSGERGLSGAAADIRQLWVNNGDAPHASLYYMALRLALIGYDAFDVHDFMMRGGILNLLFFCLSFLMMYKLLRCIFGNRPLLVYVGLTMAFCNLLSIRNTTLVREYQMAETSVIALTWLAVSLIRRLRAGGVVPWKRYVPALAATVGCVISLGYFNAVYVLALGLGLMFACWRYGAGKSIGWVVLSGMAGVVFAYLLYPGFFNFMLHPTVHKAMAFRNFPLAVSTVFCRDLPRLLFISYGNWIVVAAFVAAVFAKGGVKSLLHSRNFAWLPVVALVCIPLIQYASVLKHPRYYYSLLPVLMLFVPLAVSVMSVLWRRYFGLLIILFFPVLTAQIKMPENYGWGRLAKGLETSATVYRLNPNELAQIVPCLNDKAEYTVLNGRNLKETLENGEEKTVISKPGQWKQDEFVYVGRLLWNRNIYLFNIRNVSPATIQE